MPTRFNAITAFPVLIVPGGRLNSSPIETLTEGATDATTILPDFIASDIMLSLLCSFNAPEGHTYVH